jgi:hypothetical protein
MKLTDFGLWFKDCYGKWLTTIPKDELFRIYYDGLDLGKQYSDYDLLIYHNRKSSYIVKLKKEFDKKSGYHIIGRRLTMDDFEVVKRWM